MASDLAIHAATTLLTMQAERTGVELGTRLMKMRLQQDQQLVRLLMEQARQIQQAGYDRAAQSVGPVEQGGVDVTL